MAAYSDCPQELSDFLFYMLTIKGRSRKTVDAYYVDLRTFLRYIKAVKIDHGNVNDPDYFHQISIQDVGLDTISTVTLSDVYRFLDYTLSERQNNAKTRSRKVSAIRSFFNYLTVKENKLTENPVKNLEVPSVKKSVPKYLT